MIPKIIHYCWFGGKPIPEKNKKCINSWKEFCPDYEIIEWNESNYDVKKNKYMIEAYNSQNWGFVPDFARLDIIYNYGGIYLDTDVEIIKSLDPLLNEKAFMGFEDGYHVSPGLGFGAEKGNSTVKMIMDAIYKDRAFILSDGNYDTTASPKMNTAFLIQLGLKTDNSMQLINNSLKILPKDYLCPKDFFSGKLCVTNNTYSIHHFDGSWLPEEELFKLELRRKLCKFMPRPMASKCSKIIAISKYEGLSELKNYVLSYCNKRIHGK